MDTAIASELLDVILAAERSLVVLRCADVPPLLELMRRHAIRTGQALYAWSEDAGLSSLRDGQVTVAGSHRFADALRHVIQSAHYGIYFFADQPQAFDAPLVPLLRQVARLTGEHARRVVLVGIGIELPGNIEALELDRDAMTPARPRLRNGRWVSHER
ncbi:MAG TPA: hypothetical protein VJ722_07130 [Rhodanobacteraceae bacterium]|nr:hypothetical protein [Rhodanobacteraceae bacterium]